MRHTRTVWTNGKPRGSFRKSNPGRFTLARVAVVGAIPNPAEINHILVWISWANWVAPGLAPDLAQAAKKASWTPRGGRWGESGRRALWGIPSKGGVFLGGRRPPAGKASPCSASSTK